MISHNPDVPSISEICNSVKNLGYGIAQHVRLNGEEFEVVSDPFPEGDGIAVHAKTRRHSEVRVVRIPATVLQSVTGRGSKAA